MVILRRKPEEKRDFEKPKYAESTPTVGKAWRGVDLVLARGWPFGVGGADSTDATNKYMALSPKQERARRATMMNPRSEAAAKVRITA